jgi:hypothetical protein
VQAVGTTTYWLHFEAQDQMEHGESYGHIIGGGWLSLLRDGRDPPLLL